MSDPYYDLAGDWELVAASFQSMYGIRLARELPTMTWSEFAALLAGLGQDTPLGRIAAIRAEEDPERLKEFTPSMRRIRSQWRTRKAAERPKPECEAFLAEMKRAFLTM